MSATATYDLHLHTYWSHDASAAPENHLERAAQLGVTYMAITEHDNLDSLDELLQAAVRYPDVRVIPSAELTVSTSIGDVDLLCHGFPISNPPELQSLIQMYAQMRLDTARAVAHGLAELGCDFDEERQTELAKSYRPAHVVDKQGPSQVHGPVLRGYLLETGAIVDEDEFSELRARAKKIAGAPSYPVIDQVVPVAKQLGAVVSIAHPTLYLQEFDVQRLDALREEIDFDGIECAHPAIPDTYTPRYRNNCVEHELVSTAGSDSHTEAHIEAEFATHGGADEWMDELCERLPGQSI